MRLVIVKAIKATGIYGGLVNEKRPHDLSRKATPEREF